MSTNKGQAKNADATLNTNAKSLKKARTSSKAAAKNKKAYVNAQKSKKGPNKNNVNVDVAKAAKKVTNKSNKFKTTSEKTPLVGHLPDDIKPIVKTFFQSNWKACLFLLNKNGFESAYVYLISQMKPFNEKTGYDLRVHSDTLRGMLKSKIKRQKNSNKNSKNSVDPADDANMQQPNMNPNTKFETLANNMAQNEVVLGEGGVALSEEKQVQLQVRWESHVNEGRAGGLPVPGFDMSDQIKHYILLLVERHDFDMQHLKLQKDEALKSVAVLKQQLSSSRADVSTKQGLLQQIGGLVNLHTSQPREWLKDLESYTQKAGITGKVASTTTKNLWTHIKPWCEYLMNGNYVPSTAHLQIHLDERKGTDGNLLESSKKRIAKAIIAFTRFTLPDCHIYYQSPPHTSSDDKRIEMTEQVLSMCQNTLQNEIKALLQRKPSSSEALKHHKLIIQKAAVLFLLLTGGRPQEAAYAIYHISDTFSHVDNGVVGMHGYAQSDKYAFTVPREYTKTNVEYKFYLDPSIGGKFYHDNSTKIQASSNYLTQKAEIKWEHIRESVRYGLEKITENVCYKLKHDIPASLKRCNTCIEYNPRSVRRYYATRWIWALAESALLRQEKPPNPLNHVGGVIALSTYAARGSDCQQAAHQRLMDAYNDNGKGTLWKAALIKKYHDFHKNDYTRQTPKSETPLPTAAPQTSTTFQINMCNPEQQGGNPGATPHGENRMREYIEKRNLPETPVGVLKRSYSMAKVQSKTEQILNPSPQRGRGNVKHFNMKQQL